MWHCYLVGLFTIFAVLQVTLSCDFLKCARVTESICDFQYSEVEYLLCTTENISVWIYDNWSIVYLRILNRKMTSTKIPIPIYDPTQSYELYKAELELWNSVTDMPAAKRAGCVMLTLPRTAECTLRTTVMQKIDKTKINESGGFKVLTDCLDSILGKDKLQDCVDKYDEFEDYHRTKETIREYIQTFDTNYNKLMPSLIT